MKSVFFFAILALVASCYAACDCAADQAACLQNCVVTTNQCVVQCQKDGAGELCEQKCLVANWPSMSVELEKVTKGMAAVTTGTMATATAITSRIANSVSGSVGATTASVPRPSTGASPSIRPTGTQDNTSDAKKKTVDWTFVITLAAFYFF